MSAPRRERPAARPAAGPRLVYSTGSDADGAARCPCCGETRCRRDAATLDPAPAEHPPLAARPEQAGRRGKEVTVVESLHTRRERAESLLRELKRRLGAGGTLVERSSGGGSFALELQGDAAERVVEELARLGYRARRSGGCRDPES